MGVLMLSAFIFSGDGFDRISKFSVTKQTAGDQGDAGGESLRARLAELQTQKEAAETRLRGVQESAATLESRLRELQAVGEQASKREEIMSQKEATIAELRQRLELAGANQSSVSSLLESMKKENNQLQAQLAEANSQKRLIDSPADGGTEAECGVVGRRTRVEECARPGVSTGGGRVGQR